MVFLRFCSPNNRKEAFDKEEINYWMPVDQYIGGVEHAITSSIFEIFYESNWIKKILLKEPFKGLFTQGMVCHHTYKDEIIIGEVQRK